MNQDEEKIVPWMLEPFGDFRSSMALEVAQNEFRIQGLELDYSIVCWDGDFTWDGGQWISRKISGDDWNNPGDEDELAVRSNAYRVLLTRARKGMVIFVPEGDLEKISSRRDETRSPEIFEKVKDSLIASGVEELSD